MLASCDKNQKPEEIIPQIKEEPGAQAIIEALSAVKSTGENINLKLTSNLDWSLSIIDMSNSSSKWLDVNPKSGVAGSFTLNFKAEENQTPDAREAKVKIVCGNSSKEVVIKQLQKDILEGKDASITIEAAGGDFKVPIKYNVNYNVTIKDGVDWISRTDTKALESKELSFKVQANKGTQRSAKVEIEGAGKKVIIDVSQAAYNVNLPDANFRAYVLKNYDLNKDSLIDSQEAAKVDSLGLNTSEIYSLDGIENFENLKILYCIGGDFDYTEYNDELGLPEVDVEDLSELVGKLTTVDLSNNLELKKLMLMGNKLSKLNISANTKMTKFAIADNTFSQSVDLSKFDKLNVIGLQGDKINTLQLPSTSVLQFLLIDSTKISSLDLSKCANLEFLEINKTPIESLDLNICAKLVEFHCDDSKLKNLKFDKCKELKDISTEKNLLKSLSIDNMPNLTRVECGNNVIEQLSIKNCPLLKDLSSSYNPMSNLEIISCNKLTDLYTNSLVPLNIKYSGHGTNIKQLNITVAENVLIENLPEMQELILRGYGSDINKIKIGNIKVVNCPKLYKLNSSWASFKGIVTESCPNLYEFYTENTSFQNFDFSGLKTIKQATFTLCNVDYLDFSPCESLEYLYCSSMKDLSGINIDNNKKLRELFIHNTAIKNITIGILPVLNYVKCTANDELTSLVFSGQTNLEVLDCQMNYKLSKLQLSKLDKLSVFKCNSCGELKEIKLDDCKQLEYAIIESCHKLQKIKADMCSMLTSIKAKNCSELKEIWLPKNNLHNEIDYRTESYHKKPILKLSDRINLGPYTAHTYAFDYCYSYYPLIIYKDGINRYLSNRISFKRHVQDALQFEWDKLTEFDNYIITGIKNIDDIKF